jgi:hypothetical protein
MAAFFLERKETKKKKKKKKEEEEEEEEKEKEEKKLRWRWYYSEWLEVDTVLRPGVVQEDPSQLRALAVYMKKHATTSRLLYY